MKIKYINPQGIFLTEPPTIIKNLNSFDYYDKTEIGMRSYLQILASIGLYGFKYVVILDNSNKVLDGNFRVYSALELGLKVPCICLKNREGLPEVIYRYLWRVRKVIGIKFLFQRKFRNPHFSHKKIQLVCKFQRIII